MRNCSPEGPTAMTGFLPADRALRWDLMVVVGLIVLLVAEVWVIIQAAHLIGAGFTVALLLLVPWIGFHFVRRQGVATIREVQQQLARRQVPGVTLIDGLLILVAGVGLVVPGVINDVIGLVV